MTEPHIDRQALAADFDRVREDFHFLLNHVDADEWRAPTNGTRWTNEELLFHMVFGYMIVQKLLIIARLFGRLPTAVDRGFSSVLNAATGPFDWANYLGTRLAARIFNRRRMGAKLDRTLDDLLRSLSRETEHSLHAGMHYPSRWDPYFTDRMTLADIYRYPGRHYDHHRKQLTLNAIQ